MAECCTKIECTEENENPDHRNQISRLNRISGQVEGVKKMIYERRYCPDILTQLRAIRSALNSLESNILECHLGCCVTDAFASADEKAKKEKIDELVDIFKRFG